MKPTVGRIVHFVPPTGNVGPNSIKLVAAIITQVNLVNPNQEGPSNSIETVDLTTFGPSSLYFQHSIPFSEELKPGHWSWPQKA